MELVGKNLLKKAFLFNFIIATNLEIEYVLGCENKDLWGLCAPIFIIVVYSRTATSYFLGAKE